MDTSHLGRVVGAFLGVVVLAIGLGLVLNFAFVAVGATPAVATQLAVPVAITIAFVASDAYTALGRGLLDGLRGDPRRLAFDLALAAVVAFATTDVIVALDVAGPGVPGGTVVPVGAGIVAGYGSFIYRNREHFRAGAPDA